jgi:hypothetical protein
VALTKFGRNRRLVLIFEWLTLWPTWADLPVNSHRRDMANLYNDHALPPGRALSRGRVLPEDMPDNGVSG